MPFCIHCGVEIAPEQQACGPCQEASKEAQRAGQRESAPTAEGVLPPSSGEPSGPASQAPIVSPATYYGNLFKELILQPEIALPRFIRYANIYPGLIVALASALITSLAGILIIHSILSEIGALFGSLLGDLGPFNGFSFGKAKSLESALNISYLLLFIKIFIFSVGQWAVLAFAAMGISRMFGVQLSPLQAFNGAGAASLYPALSWILVILFASIDLIYGLVFIQIGWLAGYIALQKTLSPLAKDHPLATYTIPLIALGSAIGSALLALIF